MLLQTYTQRDTLVQEIHNLAQEKFAPRAAQYDSTAQFPHEDFADLIRADLHAPAIPTEFGGMGFGPHSDILALWLTTKTLAQVDLSLARCWEGHVNSQVLLTAMGNPDQQKQWFQGIVERGEIWAAWSGEPQTKLPGQTRRFGTTVEKVAVGDKGAIEFD